MNDIQEMKIEVHLKDGDTMTLTARGRNPIHWLTNCPTFIVERTTYIQITDNSYVAADHIGGLSRVYS